MTNEQILEALQKTSTPGRVGLVRDTIAERLRLAHDSRKRVCDENITVSDAARAVADAKMCEDIALGMEAALYILTGLNHKDLK